METPVKKIAYLCDQNVCEYCSYPLCKRTTDIRHAKNFKELEEGRYAEKDDGYQKFADEVIKMLMLFCDDDNEIHIKKCELEVNMKSIMEDFTNTHAGDKTSD